MELAKQFAQNGFDLAISGSSDKVTKAAEELRSMGAQCYPYQADASTYEGVEGLWKAPPWPIPTFNAAASSGRSSDTT